MTLKSYIWGMRLFALVSLCGLGFVVFYVDPETAGIFGKIIFYLALFFSLSGIINLFLVFLRRKAAGNEAALAAVGLSFRQAVLLSVLTAGLLFLQSLRALVWWDGLLLVAGVFLVELYFLSRN